MNREIDYNQLDAEFELKQNADIGTMLKNMDVFETGVSIAIKDKYPEMFKALTSQDAKVELTDEEKNALLDWLEIDFAPVIDKHRAAIDFLRTDKQAETEDEIKTLLDLEKSVNTQQSYWGEKHRGKRFAYELVRKLIHQK